MRQPQTSREAWKSISKEQLSNHHLKIISALEKLKAASAEQIAAYCSLDHWQVNRRMSELEKEGRVYKRGDTTKTKTGRSAYLWRRSYESLNSKPIIQKKLFDN